jgi:hypothetical protein
LQWIGFYQLNPKPAQDYFSLPAGVLWQTDGDRVRTRRCDHRVSDAGVTAGGVQDCHAGSESAAALSIEDHCQRGTVLH